MPQLHTRSRNSAERTKSPDVGASNWETDNQTTAMATGSGEAAAITSGSVKTWPGVSLIVWSKTMVHERSSTCITMTLEERLVSVFKFAFWACAANIPKERAWREQSRQRENWGKSKISTMPGCSKQFSQNNGVWACPDFAQQLLAFEKTFCGSRSLEQVLPFETTLKRHIGHTKLNDFIGNLENVQEDVKWTMCFFR